eukprot:1161481-Pelagomonas_calceolata.AAC.7
MQQGYALKRAAMPTRGLIANVHAHACRKTDVAAIHGLYYALTRATMPAMPTQGIIANVHAHAGGRAFLAATPGFCYAFKKKAAMLARGS